MEDFILDELAKSPLNVYSLSLLAGEGIKKEFYNAVGNLFSLGLIDKDINKFYYITEKGLIRNNQIKYFRRYDD